MAPSEMSDNKLTFFQGKISLVLILSVTILIQACNTYTQANPSEEEQVVEVPAFPEAPTLQELQNRLKVIVKDSNEARLIQLSEAGIAMYPSHEAREADSPEVVIFSNEYLAMARLLNEVQADSMVSRYLSKGTAPIRDYWLKRAEYPPRQQIPPYAYGDQPLLGWRIAVDPGHISGSLADAEIEGKFVKIRASEATGYEPIAFWEANLTLATAYMVKDQLEELGARVILTRGTPGMSVEGISYADWKEIHWPQAAKDSAEAWGMTKAQLRYWLNRADDKAIFRTFYNAIDLHNRANLINLFRPHCTLIIHYNVHGPNWENRDAENYMPLADTNYMMAFIPGSYLGGELETEEDRAHALRLLLTEDWENSYHLGQAFVRRSAAHTSVAPVPVVNGLGYLNKSCVYVGEPGLYARNLSLTRLVRGPLVYGESFNQDFYREALSLNRRDTVVHDILVSKRLADVAEAYVGAVLDFAQGR